MEEEQGLKSKGRRAGKEDQGKKSRGRRREAQANATKQQKATHQHANNASKRKEGKALRRQEAEGADGNGSRRGQDPQLNQCTEQRTRDNANRNARAQASQNKTHMSTGPMKLLQGLWSKQPPVHRMASRNHLRWNVDGW